MIDIFGVGVCIACISYICCVYTTFITLSTRPLFTTDICCERRKHHVYIPTESSKKHKQKKEERQQKQQKTKQQQQQQHQPSQRTTSTKTRPTDVCQQTVQTPERQSQSQQQQYRSNGSSKWEPYSQQITKQSTKQSSKQKSRPRAPSSAGSSRCSCAGASMRLCSEAPTPLARRKIVLVASSFLDFEGASDTDQRRSVARKMGELNSQDCADRKYL